MRISLFIFLLLTASLVNAGELKITTNDIRNLEQMSGLTPLFSDYNVSTNCNQSMRTLGYVITPDKRVNKSLVCDSGYSITSELEQRDNGKTKQILRYHNFLGSPLNIDTNISFTTLHPKIVVDGENVTPKERQAIEFVPVHETRLVQFDENYIPPIGQEKGVLTEFFGKFVLKFYDPREYPSYQGKFDFRDLAGTNDLRVTLHKDDPASTRITIGFRVTVPANSDLEIDPIGDITTGLVAYWAFNEGTGTNVYDSAGDFNGYTQNTPPWTDGYTNTDLNFNGSNQRAFLGTTTDLQFTKSDSFTVSAWVLVQDSYALTRGFVNRWGGITGVGWGLIQLNTAASNLYSRLNATDGNTTGYVRNGTLSDPNIKQINDGEWHHIVMRVDRDTNEFRLFTDLWTYEPNIKDISNIGDLNNTANPLALAYTTQGYDKAKIDEVRIYDRALSNTDINALYYCQPPTQVGIEWRIDRGVSCNASDFNASVFALGANLHDVNGVLNIPSNISVVIPPASKLIMEKTPNRTNKVIVQRLGRLVLRKV